MSGAELMRLAVGGGLIALAAAALVDLRRRGGAEPAQWGLGLVATAQAAGTTTPGGSAPAWGWLLQTGALLGLLYLAWLVGRVLLEARPRQAETQPAAARETLPGLRRTQPSVSSVEPSSRVRVVASWPPHQLRKARASQRTASRSRKA